MLEEILVLAIVAGLAAVFVLDRTQKKHRRQSGKAGEVSFEKDDG